MRLFNKIKIWWPNWRHRRSIILGFDLAAGPDITSFIVYDPVTKKFSFLTKEEYEKCLENHETNS